MTKTPYPFQVEAVEFLSKQPYVLLGDEMGLGKTVTSILLDRVRRKDLPRRTDGRHYATLVLTYSSVISSWQDHFKDWAPELKVMVIDRKDRDAFVKAIKNGTHDVYIMHWEALRLIIDDIKNINFLHVIADEVQKIKNRKAQVNRAINQLRTKYKLGASGTAADNAPEDLWGVLNWLWPGRWRSFWNYYNKHVMFKVHTAGGDSYKPCEACLLNDEVKVHRNGFREVTGVAEKEELHRQMFPFYKRRLKTDVIEDLPEKYYTTIKGDLLPQQRRAYDEMEKRMLAWVGENEDQPIAAPVVIAQLIRLQQFSVAYGEMIKKTVRTKDQGDVVKDLLKLTEPSWKLDAIMDILENNPDEQIGVFGQSKQAINMLGARLEKAGITYGLLTGDTSQNDRGPLVQDFQRGRLRVFGGTVQAGGIGITLHAASTCIFLDRPWSPTQGKQAEDRFHRIGQKNAVQIIDLISRDTIDARRLEKIDLKWKYIKELLGDKPEVKKTKEWSSK